MARRGVKKVEAWACRGCGRLYDLEDEEQAASCCTCRRCGRRRVLKSVGTYCGKCDAEFAYVRAKESLTIAQRNFDVILAKLRADGFKEPKS